MIIPGEPPHIRRFRPKRSHASKACRFLLHNAPHDNGFPPIYSRFFQKVRKFHQKCMLYFFIAFYVSITVEQLFYALLTKSSVYFIYFEAIAQITHNYIMNSSFVSCVKRYFFFP